MYDWQGVGDPGMLGEGVPGQGSAGQMPIPPGVDPETLELTATGSMFANFGYLEAFRCMQLHRCSPCSYVECSQVLFLCVLKSV